MRTIDTTTRSRKWERNNAQPLARFTTVEIADAAGITRSAVSNVCCQAEEKFQAVWNLWETVDFDESRRGEIARQLDLIESLSGKEAA